MSASTTSGLTTKERGEGPLPSQRHRPPPFVVAFIAMLGVFAPSLRVSAQPSWRPGGSPHASPPADVDHAVRSSESSPAGDHGSPVAAAAALLSSPDREARLRGVERLGAIGTPLALEKLESALEGTDDVWVRLSGMRALARHAKDERASRALIRLMASSGSASSAPRPDASQLVASEHGQEAALERMLRIGAALALARSGAPDALRALSKALRGEGVAAEAAEEALVAFPPRELVSLLEVHSGPSAGLVRTLARLGDQRGFTALRDAVLRGKTEVRASAALALTRSGDLETIALARRWSEEGQPHPLGVAGARILALTHAPGASAAIGRLLARPATRSAGLELALSSGSPDLLPALERILDRNPTERALWLAAVGRAGGPRAARVLARELSSGQEPGRPAAAAFALASCPGEPAKTALERALREDATRRLAARAAVVRAVVLAERTRGLSRALERLLGSSVPADRAVGAWGLATIAPARAVALLTSADPAAVRGAAGAPLGPRAARVAASRLLREPDPLTRLALVHVLARPTLAAMAPTRTLLAWLETDPGLAFVSAYALAARCDEPDRVRDLTVSGAPALRSSVALGLGQCGRPAATGILDRMYRFEHDASVRHSVIIALGTRREVARRRTLELAAHLDADSDVRAAAMAALAGRTLADEAQGGVLWQELSSTDETTPALTLHVPGSPPVPALADPDNLVVRLGLRRGVVAQYVWAAGPKAHAVSRPEVGVPRAYSPR